MDSIYSFFAFAASPTGGKLREEDRKLTCFQPDFDPCRRCECCRGELLLSLYSTEKR